MVLTRGHNIQFYGETLTPKLSLVPLLIRSRANVSYFSIERSLLSSLEQSHLGESNERQQHVVRDSIKFIKRKYNNVPCLLAVSQLVNSSNYLQSQIHVLSFIYPVNLSRYYSHNYPVSF